MGIQTFSSALLAGVATIVATAFIGADIAAEVIDTSVVIGIPVGLFAGMFVAGAILYTCDDNPARASLAATGILGFAAGLLLTYVALTRLLGTDEIIGIGSGLVVGGIFAALAIMNNR